MEHYTWDEMEKEVLSEGLARKYVSGEKAMLAQIFLKKGSIVPTHQHDSEQITYILEGALLFRLDEDTVDLDVFSPIRQDWINKEDAYLRRPAK